jgi:opacity protein-like surface antigen
MFPLSDVSGSFFIFFIIVFMVKYLSRRDFSMKAKFVITTAVVVFCGAADAAHQNTGRPIVKNIVYGGVESRREVQYEPLFEGRLYLGVRGALNLTNFTLDSHLESAPNHTESDKYSFEQAFGFDVSAGYQFAPRWRAELNYVYAGKIEDQESNFSFWTSSSHFMANTIYTFLGWREEVSIYGGLGVGASLVSMHVSGTPFMTDGKDTQNKTTFAGQVLLGLEQSLTPNVALNLQYRLMYSGGIGIRRDDAANPGDAYVGEIGGVLTNSLMLGAVIKF